MAMEKVYTIRESHTRGVTAVGYNPARRELLIGCEDGVVKTFETENGKPVSTFLEHKGWVTDFIFWPETKLLLSSANDGELLAWGIAGGIFDRIKICVPVFCLALLPNRHHLLCGVTGGVRIYALDDERECGHVVNNRILFQARRHTDIVRCIVCLETRVFSAGYDNKLVIYDSPAEKLRLDPIFDEQVHDAGITCMCLAIDTESIWLLTGSFDRTLKVWTIDGCPVMMLDKYPAVVTGVVYIPRNKTVWVAAGASYAWLYEPKSGDKVSDFIGTFQNTSEEYQLLILKYFPDLCTAVASTSRRQLVVWKYNTAGCVAALMCGCAMESLCFTSKVPILIFSGDQNGQISKWERNQSNPFKYNKEVFLIGDPKKLKVLDVRPSPGDDGVMGKKSQIALAHPLQSLLATSTATTLQGHTRKRISQSRCKTRHSMCVRLSEDSKDDSLSATMTEPSRRRGVRRLNKRIHDRRQTSVPTKPAHHDSNDTIMKIIFIESLDYLLAASEDGNIYVWGFDMAAVKVLQNMKPVGLEELVKKYAILLDDDSPLKKQTGRFGDDSVTNRVAGFTCQYVLAGHLSCASTLLTIEKSFKYPTTYVLSGGWDRRIILWDIEAGTLKTVFRNSKAPTNASQLAQEIACDGVIHDLAFSAKNSEFAYASSDNMVYIRRFNTNGARMSLVNTLQGHENEVTCVRWSITCLKWITGSEDGTVRIWSGSGMNECEQVLNVGKSVTCLCIDQFIGTIVAGVQNDIRVYDPETYCLVQNNIGHKDTVRCIMHVPERNHYVSCSWDCSIRVWNAWKPKKKKEIQLLNIKRESPKLSQMASPDFQSVSRKLILGATMFKGLTGVPSATGRKESSSSSNDGKNAISRALFQQLSRPTSCQSGTAIVSAVSGHTWYRPSKPQHVPVLPGIFKR